MSGGQRHPWRPILAGAPAQEARAAVDAIAAAVADDPSASDWTSLAGGAAGNALLHAYLDLAFPGAGHGDRAAVLLDRAIDGLADQPLPASLHAGFAGVAWVAEHLQGQVDGEDSNEMVDEALRDHLEATPWAGHYDLISGLVGLGVYALERLPRPLAADILARVVDRLGELAVDRDGGVTWLSPPELLVPATRAAFPHGYYNLGVAHGVPGAIAVLAGACAAGVARGRAARLVDGAWRWTLGCRLDADADCAFPYWVSDDHEPRPARSAWCYGDPGTAAALYAAARQLDREAWADQAAAIARRATARPLEGTGCVDAGLCHGAAGLAHIYNRFWQWTGDDAFASAARRWYRETLALRRPNAGIAGFQAYHPGSPGEGTGWKDDPSLLTGATGVALALLAGISEVEPGWDRVLCISLPPVR